MISCKLVYISLHLNSVTICRRPPDLKRKKQMATMELLNFLVERGAASFWT